MMFEDGGSKHIDIVTPCFNEQECIYLFYNELSRVLSPLKGYSFTVTFIDDGSTDGTLAEIKRLETLYGSSRVKYISFSRNFGKEAAIFAGLSSTTGDIVALMDADLQDPPAMLPEMISVIEEGYDSCATYRNDRKGEPPIRSFFARRFYKIMNSMSIVKMKSGARDYRLMTRKMVNAVISLSEIERFSKGLFQWVGFKTKWIAFENIGRVAGKTKFSFFSLFKYAVNGIVSFSTVPLRFASVLGVFIVVAAFVYMTYVFFKTVFFGARTSGFPTTTILILFLSGVIIMLLGIIGEYIARIYSEIKKRPIFITQETNIRYFGGENKDA